MHRVFRFMVAVVCCLGAVASPTVVLAQAPKDAIKNEKGNVPAPPVSANPERTTASFGDWMMRCDAAVAPSKPVCEVAQTITLQGQTSPIAQIAIGKPAPNEGKRITVVLPANIAITTKPQAMIAKAGAAPIELIWQRCTPGACFASVPITDAAVGTFSGQTEPGRITFRDSSEREITLPLSFRGLSQALAALGKAH